jgi:hypothetical protein
MPEHADEVADDHWAAAYPAASIDGFREHGVGLLTEEVNNRHRQLSPRLRAHLSRSGAFRSDGMRISMKADYGIRALLDLAEHGGSGPVPSHDIAARQHVPGPFLD